MGVHIEQGNAGHISMGLCSPFELEHFELEPDTTAIVLDLDGGGSAVVIDGTPEQLTALGNKIIELARQAALNPPPVVAAEYAIGTVVADEDGEEYTYVGDGQFENDGEFYSLAAVDETVVSVP